MDRRNFLETSLASAGALSVVSSTAKANEKRRKKNKKTVAEIPVVLECCINGSTTKAVNSRVPATPSEQAKEMIQCLDAGATIIHSHSNEPNIDTMKAAKPYMAAYEPVRKKHPYAILYATANFDPVEYHRTRKVWPGRIQCGHQLILAKAGLANMILMDTGVVPLGAYGKDGLPEPKGYWYYGFWPDDVRYTKEVCDDYGTGASLSVFEPGWMKNVVAMAKAKSLPKGSKVNIYFASEEFPAMAPPIPEALDLYLKMMEGLDLKWSVGYIGKKSVMDTPLARLALERGGSFRVGIEDYITGPSNLDQLKRAKELIDKVGRKVVNGVEAIKYLDIPYKATRPKI